MEKRALQKQQQYIAVAASLLPILLLMAHEVPLPSISLYYYTAGVVLMAFIFGILYIQLQTYPGYPKEKDEWISDNALTNIAAIAIMGILFVPTGSKNTPGLHFYDQPYLFGYVQNNWIDGGHFLFAVVFFISIGGMAFFKFTRSPKISRRLWLFYRTCGITIWAVLLILAVMVLLDRVFGVDMSWFPNYIFWLEAVDIWVFAAAWYRKSLG